VELPGIETDALPGNMPAELPVRSVLVQFSTSRYLRFRSRVLTASRLQAAGNGQAQYPGSLASRVTRVLALARPALRSGLGLPELLNRLHRSAVLALLGAHIGTSPLGCQQLPHAGQALQVIKHTVDLQSDAATSCSSATSGNALPGPCDTPISPARSDICPTGGCRCWRPAVQRVGVIT